MNEKIRTNIYLDAEVHAATKKAVKEEKPKSSLSRKIEELLLRYLREKKEQERKV